MALKTLLFLYLTISYCGRIDCYTEIIRIEKNNNVTCIVNDPEIPIYVDPPVIKDEQNTPELTVSDLWDEWSIENSLESLQSFITDRRWEDFATTYGHYKQFLSTTSVLFSVYSPEEVRFYIDDDEYLHHFVDSTEKDRADKWVHYAIYSKNGTVSTYKHDQLINKVDDFAPGQFVVITPSDTYWKTQKYQIRSSTKISQIDKHTNIVPLSLNDVSCLMLYASLCAYCTLEIYKSGLLINTLSGGNDLFLEKSWTSQKIYRNRTDQITVLRKTNNNQTNGYWGAEVRECHPTLSGKGILNVNLPAEETKIHRKCQILNAVNKAKENNSETTDLNEKDIFYCGLGELGRDCDLRCSELLGLEGKNCEKHRICDDSLKESKCYCAWRYQGPSCTQACNNRSTCGIPCKANCDSECINCNNRTKEYNQTYQHSKLSSAPKYATLTIWSIILSITVLTNILLWKCRRRLQHLIHNEGENPPLADEKQQMVNEDAVQRPFRYP